MTRLPQITVTIALLLSAALCGAEERAQDRWDLSKIYPDRGAWEAAFDQVDKDIALVKAWMADRSGNLVFRRTARNFNPNAAMAGRIKVVEAEVIVPTGEIDPDAIHLPGIYVHRIVHNPTPEKRIEQRTTRPAR